MRLAFRLNLLLIACVAAVSMGFAYYQVRTERRSLERDLQRQALDLAESLGKAAEAPLERQSYRELQALVDRFNDRERLAGIAVYDETGELVAITAGLQSRVNGNPPATLAGAGGGRQPFRICQARRRPDVRHGSTARGRIGQIGNAELVSRRGLYRSAHGGRLAQGCNEHKPAGVVNRLGYASDHALGHREAAGADDSMAA